MRDPATLVIALVALVVGAFAAMGGVGSVALIAWGIGALAFHRAQTSGSTPDDREQIEVDEDARRCGDCGRRIPADAEHCEDCGTVGTWRK